MDVFLDEFESFRSSVPLKKVCLFPPTKDHCQTWSFFEAGPRTVLCPLLFLPPVSGGADVYFRQILSLSARGYRVISVDYPSCWSVEAFCRSFEEFLNHKQIDKVHIFGASLGGYLAQKFAEYCSASNPPNRRHHQNIDQRVLSLILCNSFCDTAIFNRQEVASL